MPDWLKANVPMIVLFVIGTYIGLQTLEVKFDYQEARATERYRVLMNIESKLADNTKQLNVLTSNYVGLDDRIARIETYVPKSITDLEKEVMLLGYKLNKEKQL